MAERIEAWLVCHIAEDVGKLEDESTAIEIALEEVIEKILGIKRFVRLRAVTSAEDENEAALHNGRNVNGD